METRGSEMLTVDTGSILDSGGGMEDETKGTNQMLVLVD